MRLVGKQPLPNQAAYRKNDILYIIYIHIEREISHFTGLVKTLVIHLKEQSIFPLCFPLSGLIHLLSIIKQYHLHVYGCHYINLSTI